MIMAQSSSTTSLSNNTIVNVVDINPTPPSSIPSSSTMLSNTSTHNTINTINTTTLQAVASSTKSSTTNTTTTAVAAAAAAPTTTLTDAASNSNTKTVSPPPSGSVSTAASNILSNSDARWIFPLEKIESTPSRIDTMTKEEEQAERQQSALFISDLGGRLKVNQLCINTAIIYMHRFYMIHSLKKFHHYVRFVATACLFFACKVEEQPRRLKELIDNVQYLLHKPNESNVHSEEYRKYSDDIMALESCLIQTLGFNVLINHAHTVIIKTCQMIKAPRELAEAAYLTATNSLILTNFCVKFSSEKVACFCIYLACKWTGLRIPMSSEGMQWYEYVNHDIKEQELEDISKEYLTIYDKCSFKIKKKLGITKSQDDTPAINKQQHQQQQQYIKKQATNPNTSHSQPPPAQQASRQTIDPHQNNHQFHNNVNIQKQNQFNKQGVQANVVPATSSAGFNPQNGFNNNTSNSHYVNQQYQQRQQQHLHQRSVSSTVPMHVNANNAVNKSLTSTSSSLTISSTNLHQTQNNSNKSVNLTSKSTSNMQTSSSNPKITNGNGVSHSISGQGGQHHPNNSNVISSQTGATHNNNKINLGNFSDVENLSKTTANNSNYQISNNNNVVKRPIKTESSVISSSNIHKMSSGPNTVVKSSPTATLTPSMKRSNDETSNGSATMAPNNKIPKYVIDQKSAS